MSTCVAALYAAAGGPPASGTQAQQLVEDWASGGAGSDGFAMVFEDAGGTDAPSIYVKDSGTPANDTDINLTDDFDAFNSFLTYTSPSPKIVRQSDGNLKYCAHNLLTYSEQMDNAVWSKNACSVTSNTTTAPDGTSTADKIVEDGTNSRHELAPPFTAGSQVYSFRAYIKSAGDSRYFYFSGFGLASAGECAIFNPDAGTVDTPAGSTIFKSATITDVGDGWYLCEITLQNSGATFAVLGVTNTTTDNSVPAYTGDGSSGVYVWGAALSLWPADTTYLPTTTAARYALPIQHDSSNNAEGLLVEPAATNLLPLSTPDDGTAWSDHSGSPTSTENAEVSPSGETDATSITAVAGTAQHYIAELFSAAATTQYVMSVYMKAGTSNFGLFRVFQVGVLSASYVIDLSDGTLAYTLTAGDAAPTITAVGNGWYRVSIVDTSTSSGSSVQFSVGPHDDSSNIIWTAAGGESIYAWGGQAELGSVPTSPIITTGATATRAADDIAGATSTIPWDEGAANTVYAKVVFRRANANYVTEIAETAGALRRHAFVLGAVSPSSIRAFISGVFDDETTGTITLNSDSKYACAIATNNYAHTLNGATVETGTSGTAPGGVDIFTLGHRVSTNGSQLNGLIKEIMYLPERMSNTDLESITT